MGPDWRAEAPKAALHGAEGTGDGPPSARATKPGGGPASPPLAVQKDGRSAAHGASRPGPLARRGPNRFAAAENSGSSKEPP